MTYSEIEKLIEEGQIAKSQELLLQEADRFKERGEECDAEWHYLYSLMLRKKRWYLESKRSLKLAIKKDPQNLHYREAMDDLKKLAKNITPEEKREERKRLREYYSDKYDCWCWSCLGIVDVIDCFT